MSFIFLLILMHFSAYLLLRGRYWWLFSGKNKYHLLNKLCTDIFLSIKIILNSFLKKLINQDLSQKLRLRYIVIIKFFNQKNSF